MKKKLITMLIAAAGLFIALFCLHYYIAYRSEPTIVEARISSKYTKTRHRSRRVGRRVYANGEPYKVYYFEVELEDGSRKDLQVSLEKYNKRKPGANVKVARRKGLFGIEVYTLN